MSKEVSDLTELLRTMEPVLNEGVYDAGISCNVVAAAYHDHIFVPIDLAHEALACLRALQEHCDRDQETR